MGTGGMNRVYSDKVLEASEMHDLARALERCGFHDFYDKVEIWRIADAARSLHPGDDR